MPEASAPNVELTLTAAENPTGMQPLNTPLNATTPLWSRVRGALPYGFNIQDRPLADEVLLSKEAGASIARVPVDWGWVRYYYADSPSTPAWKYVDPDAQYKAFVKAGIRPLLRIQKTPKRFTRLEPVGSTVSGLAAAPQDWLPPRTDTATLQELQKFAQDIAKRYPLAAGIELWNEPNFGNPFWGGDAPNAQTYAAMLAYVHTGVKAVRPNMPVIGGSLAKIKTASALNAPLKDYLVGMLNWNAQPFMDAFAWHPYLGPYPTGTLGGRTPVQQLADRQYEETLLIKDAYALAGKTIEERLVPTEFGCSTTDGYATIGTDGVQDQRRWLMRQFQAYNYGNTAQTPLANLVDGAIFHETVESPGLGTREGFGWTKPKDASGKYPTKQVYCAFRQTFGYAADCPASI